MLLPGEAHRGAVDGQVYVADDRALFHLGAMTAARTAHVRDDLLDHELDVTTAAFVREDADVLQTNEGLEDLTRVDEDEGASVLLAHTSSLKRLRPILGDPGTRGSPLRSEDPEELQDRLVSGGRSACRACPQRSSSVWFGVP